MEKKKENNVLEIARDHLGSIDLICRLLFLAAATEGFVLDYRSIGHLAGFLHNFRDRHMKILNSKGV